MDFIKVNAKAIIAFVATVLLNALVDLLNGARPWPQNAAEWIQYLVTAFGAALAVYTTTNKLTVKQVEKGLPGLPNPGAAVAAALPAMAHTVQVDLTNRVLDSLPPVVKGAVKQFWE